jgi:hypothetical protein
LISRGHIEQIAYERKRSGPRRERMTFAHGREHQPLDKQEGDEREDEIEESERCHDILALDELRYSVVIRDTSCTERVASQGKALILRPAIQRLGNIDYGLPIACINLVFPCTSAWVRQKGAFSRQARMRQPSGSI